LPTGALGTSYRILGWQENTVESIEYVFQKPETISESSVYWFDDGPDGGCRIPSSWKIMYKLNNQWKPVISIEPYRVEKNKLNSIHFEPVKTQSIKIEVTLQKEWSGGLYEWSAK